MDVFFGPIQSFVANKTIPIPFRSHYTRDSLGHIRGNKTIISCCYCCWWWWWTNIKAPPTSMTLVCWAGVLLNNDAVPFLLRHKWDLINVYMDRMGHRIVWKFTTPNPQSPIPCPIAYLSLLGLGGGCCSVSAACRARWTVAIVCSLFTYLSQFPSHHRVRGLGHPQLNSGLVSMVDGGYIHNLVVLIDRSEYIFA